MEGVVRVRRIPKAGITDSTLRRLLQGQARLVQRPLLSGGGRLCSRGDLVVRHRDGRLHQGAHSREARPRRRSRHTCLSIIFFSFIPYRLPRFFEALYSNENISSFTSVHTSCPIIFIYASTFCDLQDVFWDAYPSVVLLLRVDNDVFFLFNNVT